MLAGREIERRGESAVAMFHMFGSMNMYAWDGCLPGAYTWGKKKERTLRNLHWHGGGEESHQPLLLSDASGHLNPGGRGFFFTLHLDVGCPSNFKARLCWFWSEGRMTSNCYYCYCHNSQTGWLAGGNFREKRDRSCFTWQQTVDFQKWDSSSFSPTPSGKLKLRNLWRVLGKSPDISNQTFFFFFFSNPPMWP